MQQGRIAYIDALRTVACFFVIMLHITAQNTYYVDFQSHEWNVFMGYEAIVNWAVPIFVMISGAMMLGKEGTANYTIISWKIKRVVSVFITWSVFYLLSDICLNGGAFYKQNFLWLQVLLQGHYHMWYLIMLCGIYLITPMIKEIINNEYFAKIYIILVMVFAFIIPSVKDIQQISYIRWGGALLGAAYRAFFNIYSDLYFYFPLGYVGYYIIGYFIHQKIGLHKKEKCINGRVLLLLGTVILFVEIFGAVSKESASLFMQYYQVGILLQASGIMLITKSFAEKKIILFLARISHLSFGIYMIHPLIIEVLQKKGITSMSFTPVISIPTLTIVVFISSSIIIYILSLTSLKRWVMI